MRYTSRYTVVALLLVLWGLAGCGVFRKKTVRRRPVVIKHELPSRKSYNLPQAEPTIEMRAVWLTTIYGLDWPSQSTPTAQQMQQQRQELCQILDRIKESNFNTVFLQVRHRGDVIYPSRIEPQSALFAGSLGATLDNDPLEFAIAECRRRGLSIHAWVVTFPLGNNAHVRRLASQGGVWSQFREWCFSAHNDWYLNPGVPEAREHIINVVCEMVRRYDLDGVHFDYVRYPDKITDKIDRATYQKYGRGESLATWRTENISTFLRDASQSIRAIKPYLLVSAAPLGKLRVLPSQPEVGFTCREDVYQDPAQWYREGSVDFVAPMMYYKDNLFDPYLVDWLRQIPGLPIVPGLAPYRIEDGSGWTWHDIENQINSCRRVHTLGISFYREQHIRPGNSGVYDLLQQHFMGPARMPSFPRRDPIAPPAPSQLRVTQTQSQLLLSWNMPFRTRNQFTFNVYVADISKGVRNPSYQLVATLLPNRHFVLEKAFLNVPKRHARLSFYVEAANRAYLVSKPSQSVEISLN